jgi:cytochrome c oxidase assembly protein subunit 15
MKWNSFQKTAVAALISVLVLMFVGATVRVTGSGMGCPDWPTCWGCLIPPTKVDDVDFSKLPIERFQKKAQRMGRDPETITVDSLRAEFNPRHVWTEFINRLCSLPVGALSLATFVLGFGQRCKRPLVFWMAFGSLLVVLINAWMGARVVYSGLKPGVLTTHLALAMALTGMLVYCAWHGTSQPWHIEAGKGLGKLRFAAWGLLVLIVIEGICGSQVRELTDEMAKFRVNAPRSTWIGELERSGLYLFHRSFSWAILAITLWGWVLSKRWRPGGPGLVEKGILAIVLAQMVLGLVMAQVHLYSWVQVLHVGLAAVLLSLVWLWCFGLSKAGNQG